MLCVLAQSLSSALPSAISSNFPSITRVIQVSSSLFSGLTPYAQFQKRSAFTNPQALHQRKTFTHGLLQAAKEAEASAKCSGKVEGETYVSRWHLPIIELDALSPPGPQYEETNTEEIIEEETEAMQAVRRAMGGLTDLEEEPVTDEKDQLRLESVCSVDPPDEDVVAVCVEAKREGLMRYLF